MIAAGLCLMGGCFAQDESSQVVESYWPAHSVHLVNRSVTIKPASEELSTPIWRVEGLYIEARVENLSWTERSTIFSVGKWADGVSDAFYMGTGDSARNGVTAYGVGRNRSGGIRRLYVENPPQPVDYAYVTVHNLSLTLDMPGYSGTVNPEPGSDATGTFAITINAAGKEFDFVVSGWCDDVRGMYYMNQPMVSVSQAEAVFTHGFNILTEI